eukprot:Opistho-2@11226
MGHGLIGPIDGQGVLDQVIGADGHEVDVAQQQGQHHSRRRNLDHDAEIDLGEGVTGIGQLLLHLLDRFQDLPHLAQVGDHGDQQPHLAEGTGAVDGAQLLAEHAGLGQAPADGPQTHGGIEHMLVAKLAGTHAVQRFVRADVDGANGHRHALHRLHRGAVGGELFVLAGQLAVAVHEQELAAEQAHAGGPGLDGRRRIDGQLDIGVQLDVFSVQRHRRCVAQAGQAGPLQLALALAEAVFLKNDGRGVDDHRAGVAVDDDPVVLADQARGLARADHGRDVHAAGNDGRVRGLAADVGDKTVEDAALELHHVRRRDVGGHQQQRI